MLNSYFNSFYTFGGDFSNTHSSKEINFAKKYKFCKHVDKEGLSGQSYVIPIYDSNGHLLPINKIKFYINNFISFAKNNLQMKFQISKIACNKKEYDEKNIALLFQNVPSNCLLPADWLLYFSNKRHVCILSEEHFEDSELLNKAVNYFTQNLKNYFLVHNDNNVTIKNFSDQYGKSLLIPINHTINEKEEFEKRINIEELYLYSNYFIIFKEKDTFSLNKMEKLLKENNNKKYKIIKI